MVSSPVATSASLMVSMEARDEIRRLIADPLRRLIRRGPLSAADDFFRTPIQACCLDTQPPISLSLSMESNQLEGKQ